MTLPNPDGVFADFNRTIPYMKLGLPVSYADGASIDAARGLNLATPGGCNEAIDGRAWIANLPGKISKVLHTDCAREVAALQPVLRGSPDALNAAAAAAWTRFDGHWSALLTPEQRARIATISEHGHHDGGHVGEPMDMHHGSMTGH